MIKQKVISHIKDKKKQNFFIYGIGQAFNLVSPLLVIPHILYVCGEDGFAKVGLGFAVALFLILIVDYAFEIKGTKEVSENRDDTHKLSKIYSTTITSKIFLFIGVFILLGLLVNVVPYLQSEQKLYIFSLAIVLAQVFNPVWFLQGIENFKAVTALNIASKILYLAMVYIFVAHEDDYVLVNLFLGLSTLLFNIIGLGIIHTKHNVSYTKPEVKEIIYILKADFSFCLSQLFLSVRQLSPLFFTSYFLGYFAGGQYKLIEQIIMLFRTLLQVFLKYFYPLVCYKIKSDKSEAFAFWKKYSLLGFGLVIFGVLLLYVFPERILLYFNASTDTVQEISATFRIALIIPVLMAISLPLEQLMFITGRENIFVRVAIVVTIVNVALLYVLVNHYAVAGAIYSLIIAEVFFITLYFIYSYLHLSRKTK